MSIAARARRTAWWALGLGVVSVLVYLMATASTGPVDPTEARGRRATRRSSFNSAMIVFREGLEAVLIFAAVTASFLGANQRRRRPVVAGAGVAFARRRRDVVRRAGRARRRVAARPAAGGDHRLPRDRRAADRPELVRAQGLLVGVDRPPPPPAPHSCSRATGIGATLGLVALGFTSVYREGFEVVLFLQNLRAAGRAARPCSRASALGLAATAVVGVLTFWLHHRLPYRRMLVLTGVLVGVVLVVMIGGTALASRTSAGSRATTRRSPCPGWLGSWFEIYAPGRRSARRCSPARSSSAPTSSPSR